MLQYVTVPYHSVQREADGRESVGHGSGVIMVENARIDQSADDVDRFSLQRIEEFDNQPPTRYCSYIGALTVPCLGTARLRAGTLIYR